jgi:hypothetical protein
MRLYNDNIWENTWRMKMGITWSKEDLETYLKRKNKNEIVLNPYAPKEAKKNKYNAKKVKIDGHVFDSQKEANFYFELKIRLKAGDILSFCLQPKFILSEKITYKADFIIFEHDKTRVVDIKGFETETFKLKKKLFEEKFNIELEVIK